MTDSKPLNMLKRGCAIAATVALLTACSGWEPMDYQPSSEIPEGPGLFSGDKGGWTVFSVKEKRKKPKEEAEDSKASTE